MDPLRNPFAPGAGTPPPELSGRRELLERAHITLARARQGRPAKSFIAVGLRGVGKTVLLNRVRDMAEQLGFRICFVEAHEQKKLPALLVPHLRRVLLELDRLGALSEQVKRGLRVLKSFMTAVKLSYGGAELALDIDPEKGAADSGDMEADLPELLAAIGRAAQSRGSAVALLIDELQYLSEPEMSALIMAMHRVTQEALPVVFIGAGLPQIVALSGRSKSYAERLFDFPRVDALDFADARQALAAPAEAEGAAFAPEAVQAIFDITRGYPYFLQEWGYHSWNIAPGPVIAAADVAAATTRTNTMLDESFFRVRLDRLTPRERDYLRVMAELGPGPHRSGDIAEKLGIRVESAGPLRNGLIAKGMIYSPSHGDTAFTVPLFDEYLRRTLPMPPTARPRS